MKLNAKSRRTRIDEALASLWGHWPDITFAEYKGVIAAHIRRNPGASPQISLTNDGLWVLTHDLNGERWRSPIDAMEAAIRKLRNHLDEASAECSKALRTLSESEKLGFVLSQREEQIRTLRAVVDGLRDGAIKANAEWDRLSEIEKIGRALEQAFNLKRPASWRDIAEAAREILAETDVGCADAAALRAARDHALQTGDWSAWDKLAKVKPYFWVQS